MNGKSFQKNFYQIIAVIASFLVLALSAFNLYAFKYTEVFKLDYLSERLTTTIKPDRYLEVYRLHDYLTDFNSNTPQFIADQSSAVEFSIQSNDPRGLNTKVTEQVTGNRAEIYSELIRNNPESFTLNRQYKFEPNTDFNKVDKIYMQLILGGGEYQYSSDNKTIYFENCTLKLNTLSNVQISYNSTYKVITLTQSVFGQKLMNFKIDFNIICIK